MNASQKFENLDWLIIEAFEKKDNVLKKNYWNAVQEILTEDDENFADWLKESGMIDTTLKYLFETHRTPKKVKAEIRKNKLDDLAKYYNLRDEFNEAYAKYKRLTK